MEVTKEQLKHLCRSLNYNILALEDGNIDMAIYSLKELKKAIERNLEGRK